MQQLSGALFGHISVRTTGAAHAAAAHMAGGVAATGTQPTASAAQGTAMGRKRQAGGAWSNHETGRRTPRCAYSLEICMRHAVHHLCGRRTVGHSSGAYRHPVASPPPTGPLGWPCTAASRMARRDAGSGMFPTSGAFFVLLKEKKETCGATRHCGSSHSPKHCPTPRARARAADHPRARRRRRSHPRDPHARARLSHVLARSQARAQPLLQHGVCALSAVSRRVTRSRRRSHAAARPTRSCAAPCAATAQCAWSSAASGPCTPP